MLFYRSDLGIGFNAAEREDRAVCKLSLDGIQQSAFNDAAGRVKEFELDENSCL